MRLGLTLPAVLVDLDGTVCNTSHRHHLIDHAREGGPDWHRYSMECLDDTPVDGVIRLVRDLYLAQHPIIIVSGRQDAATSLTRRWLDRFYVPYDLLFLRAEGDRRTNPRLKSELVTHILGHRIAKIDFAIDDHPGVATALWEDHGIPTVLVSPNGVGTFTAENQGEKASA